MVIMENTVSLVLFIVKTYVMLTQEFVNVKITLHMLDLGVTRLVEQTVI